MMLHWNQFAGMGLSTTKRCLVSIAMVIGLAVYVIIITITRNYEGYGKLFLKGPMEPSYPELLEYIRREILTAPSSRPYNLLEARNPANMAVEKSEHFYANASRILFHNKMNGFFVEAGALDGESMSNTLDLESRHNWTGLLVEADVKGFESMTTKSRKAWLANVCLAPHPYPEKLLFATKSQFFDSKLYRSYGAKMRAMNGLASYINPQFVSNLWFHSSQCLPLESLLLALQVRAVDLLSLDVEGAEWGIIKSFSFENFDVQVIFMEWKDPSVFTTIHHFLQKKGFRLFQNISDDYIFVKRNSHYDMPLNNLNN